MDLEAVLEDLRAMVEAESPSSDAASLTACAQVLAGIVERRLGGAPEVDDDATLTWPHRADGDAPPVLVLGHLDTVWPLGTLERLPFAVTDERITGPGVFDMKAGLVVVIHAMAALRAAGSLPGVRLLVTADEEVGSPGSRERIEAEAQACGRVLVPEPCGLGGAVKVARKGVALARVTAHGRASHSGLAPRDGINAAVALGGLLAAIEALSDDTAGTTVTPTLLRGGTTVNTVPATAEVEIDVRFTDDGEPDRVRAGLAALRADNGASIEAELTVNRPALPESATAPLLPALHAAAEACGQQVGTVAVGGGSDGNLAAAAGAAVLDGLGPDGDGAHAEHEHVTLAGVPARIDLLTELIPRVAAHATG